MGKRGLGGMDPEKRRLIQSMGGRAVPDHLRAFSADKSLARAAGKAGGKAKAKSRNLTKESDHVRENNGVVDADAEGQVGR
jgi:hypothetical protein